MYTPLKRPADRVGGDQTLAFSSPLVRQVRNAHSYLADFVAEQPLYVNAGELVRHLLALPSPSGQQELARQMMDLTTNMFKLGIIEAPKELIACSNAISIIYSHATLHIQGNVDGDRDVHCITQQFSSSSS